MTLEDLYQAYLEAHWKRLGIPPSEVIQVSQDTMEQIKRYVDRWAQAESQAPVYKDCIRTAKIYVTARDEGIGAAMLLKLSMES